MALAKTLMIQGTGSHVGKSFIVAGLCRVFSARGVSVAPFKSQNMALNSFATRDGREIGWAQAIQARAAGIEPIVEMNPIHLKPTSDRQAQVIVDGRPTVTCSALEYHGRKKEMLDIVGRSLDELRKRYDLVIIEGAGSPAEINLLEQDIVNMAIANLANAPVILAADIDRGGAFAALYGTLALLPEGDRRNIRGFVLNKFRGDPELLEGGIDYLKNRTGVPTLGVIPYSDIRLGEEDSVAFQDRAVDSDRKIRIAVPLLPRISNFTDFQPLELIKDVSVDFISAGSAVGRPDAVIIPGSKNTIGDMRWLAETGIAAEIKALAASGVPVFGVCAGFQMLGDTINDPHGIEGAAGAKISGLGLIAAKSSLSQRKKVEQANVSIIGPDLFGRPFTERPVAAYEIHAGETAVTGPGRPFSVSPEGDSQGWVRADSMVVGTYLHGLFENDGFRRSFVTALTERRGLPPIDCRVPDFTERIDGVARLLTEALNMSEIERLIDEGTKAERGVVARAK